MIQTKKSKWISSDQLRKTTVDSTSYYPCTGIANGNLLTNLKAGERFGKALDMSLGVMRKTPHTRLKKSAFELHYGRKPNTETSNLLNLDEIEKLTKRSVSAKQDTLQV